MNPEELQQTSKRAPLDLQKMGVKIGSKIEPSWTSKINEFLKEKNVLTPPARALAKPVRSGGRQWLEARRRFEGDATKIELYECYNKLQL